ncbi:unnamed protein product [Strongylus vulgaris]|uniref:FHA domain-containing protein n=1 Tax=Strongylus vulgaris TaxID=40348 RepID=A0A3P7KWM3_STRVU|nr:unnamed protein product [Strongylus vulgaris]
MTGETAKTPPVKADATTAQIDEKAKFAVPEWATRPPAGSHLDVCKGDQLIQKLMIDEKPAYYFGRNPKQVDFAVEHASCSRVHALLMYHGVLKRFALVDMESSHGTFLGNIRLEPLKVVFVDIGVPFHFGASTRRLESVLPSPDFMNFFHLVRNRAEWRVNSQAQYSSNSKQCKN